MGRDDEEYKAFVVSQYARLVRAALLFGCSPQDAEDAAQETLIRCYTSWTRVNAAHDRDAYVYRILVNGISHGWRRKWRLELPFGNVPETMASSDVAHGVSVQSAVQSSLGRLSLPHRQVLVLRYFVDLTEGQTADVLGVAPGTVKSRASRALALLSKDPALSGVLTPHEENE